MVKPFLVERYFLLDFFYCLYILIESLEKVALRGFFLF